MTRFTIYLYNNRLPLQSLNNYRGCVITIITSINMQSMHEISVAALP